MKSIENFAQTTQQGKDQSIDKCVDSRIDSIAISAKNEKKNDVRTLFHLFFGELNYRKTISLQKLASQLSWHKSFQRFKESDVLWSFVVCAQCNQFAAEFVADALLLQISHQQIVQIAIEDITRTSVDFFATVFPFVNGQLLDAEQIV